MGNHYKGNEKKGDSLRGEKEKLMIKEYERAKDDLFRALRSFQLSVLNHNETERDLNRKWRLGRQRRKAASLELLLTGETDNAKP